MGVGVVFGENPLWAEASVGLHLTQQRDSKKKGKEIPFVLSDLTKEVFAGSGGISCSLCQNNKLSPLCNLCELLPSWCTVG